MLVMQVLAGVFIVLSAACFFGPQLIIYGPKSFATLKRDRYARGIASSLVMISVLAVVAPFYGPAALDGGQLVSAVAFDIFTLDYGLV